MQVEPVALHELHPVNDRTEGRVHLVDLHSLTNALAQEAGSYLAVAKTGQHPAVLAGLPLQDDLLLAKVQSLDEDGFARFPSTTVADVFK